MARKVKKHKRIRITCKKCGRNHRTSEHKSHGKGSFKRTRPKKKRKRRKR